jgi:hypothetical protein
LERDTGYTHQSFRPMRDTGAAVIVDIPVPSSVLRDGARLRESL